MPRFASYINVMAGGLPGMHNACRSRSYTEPYSHAAMSGLRKSHTKTRKGCGRCKHRKVRCDLRPPRCSNCERRGEACDFSAGGTDYCVSELYVRNGDSEFRTPIGFDLAIYFDALTSSTFDLPKTPLVWRKDLVKRADSQLYLRQSSLALAALHIMHLRPTQVDVPFLYQKAYAYQDEACCLFRRSVQEVDLENGPAVLAFCVMTVMFHFSASLADCAASDGMQSMDVINPFLAVRSGALLLASCREVTIHHESLSGALGRLNRDVGRTSTPSTPDTQAALQSLDEARLCIQTAGYATVPTLHAFQVLRKVFTLFSPVPKGWLHLIYWPAFVPDEYVEELKQENPGSIIVFIYWCAYLHSARHQWYLEKWPRIAASHKLRKVEQQWHNILAWPQARLGL